MVVISVFAGDFVSDARQDQRKPQASVRGIMGKRQAEAMATRLQADAGGQAAHVIYLALPWDTAMARYTLTV